MFTLNVEVIRNAATFATSTPTNVSNPLFSHYLIANQIDSNPIPHSLRLSLRSPPRHPLHPWSRRTHRLAQRHSPLVWMLEFYSGHEKLWSALESQYLLHVPTSIDLVWATIRLEAGELDFLGSGSDKLDKN
jgi:hypothetical protein